MTEKLPLLVPEIVLFVGACAAMLMGVSASSAVRSAVGFVTVGAAAIAGLFALPPVASFCGLPAPGDAFLSFTKAMVGAVGVVTALLLTGVAAPESRSGLFVPGRSHHGEFCSFFLLSLMGVMLCATADDLVWLFLALELTSLPTYVMVALSSSRLRAQEASVKYFFLGAMGAAVFLFGFALLYGATGSTQLSGIQASFASNGLGPLGLAGLALAFLGVSFKIAAAPMHFYTADVYQGAASSVTAHLAFAPKAAGIITLIAILRLSGWGFDADGAVLGGVADAGALHPSLRVLVWVMAATTMTVGNVLALRQTSVKRMLAYSSVAHSGYMLVGLLAGPGPADQAGTVTSNGLAAALFYMLCYGVMNAGCFAVISCLRCKSERGEWFEAEDVQDLRGLTRSRPLLGWTMTLCALSLAGFPPLLGFFGKLPLFTSAVRAGEVVLIVVLAFNSAIAAWYYLRLAGAPLLEKPAASRPLPSLVPVPARVYAGAVSAVGVVLLMVFVGPLQRASVRAVLPSAPAAKRSHAVPDADEGAIGTDLGTDLARDFRQELFAGPVWSGFSCRPQGRQQPR